jgi:hypothetical protein
MSRISILKRAINTARASLVIVGMVSPAHAACQHDAVSVFPDLSNTAPANHSSPVLTAHLPWLAPVGHYQPHRVDVPQPQAVSEWERQQQKSDQQLDRKLIICRGC